MGQLEELSLSVLEQLAAVLGEEHDRKTKKTKRVVVQLADRKRTLPDGSVVSPEDEHSRTVQVRTDLQRHAL